MDGLQLIDLVDVGANVILTYVLLRTMEENRASRVELSGFVKIMLEALLTAQKERHALYSQLTARNLSDDINTTDTVKG